MNIGSNFPDLYTYQNLDLQQTVGSPPPAFDFYTDPEEILRIFQDPSIVQYQMGEGILNLNSEDSGEVSNILVSPQQENENPQTSKSDNFGVDRPNEEFFNSYVKNFYEKNNSENQEKTGKTGTSIGDQSRISTSSMLPNENNPVLKKQIVEEKKVESPNSKTLKHKIIAKENSSKKIRNFNTHATFNINKSKSPELPKKIYQQKRTSDPKLTNKKEEKGDDQVKKLREIISSLSQENQQLKEKLSAYEVILMDGLKKSNNPIGNKEELFRNSPNR